MIIGIFIGDLDPTNGGQNTLTRTIIREIVKKKSEHNYIFLYRNKIGNSKNVKSIHGIKCICINKCFSLKNRIGNGILNFLNASSNHFYELDKIAKREKIDLIYFEAPGYVLTTYPYIYTVWDLGHRIIPGYPEVSRGKEWLYREKTYTTMLPRASYIVTGNQEGKNEILKNYNINPDIIKIIPFPITFQKSLKERKPSFIKEGPFFIYPAQFWPHKNHICILEALDILRKKYNLKPRMYFTGSDQGNKAYISDTIRKMQLEDQVLNTGFLESEELKYLYLHATAMVFASVLGPNNLPPYEAIYFSCPVIISGINGHREQMEDAALYFDPYNPDELAEQMYKVLQNNEIRKDLIINANKIKEKMRDFSYYERIIELFDEFSVIRKRWK